MNIFSYDSKFTQILLKLCYSCYLNLLWFICSLPIFTIGAATSALYYTCLKIIRNTEGNVTRTFFKAFKENFRQATVIWLIMLAVGLVLAFDFYIISPHIVVNMQNYGFPSLQIPIFVLFLPPKTKKRLTNEWNSQRNPYICTVVLQNDRHFDGSVFSLSPS